MNQNIGQWDFDAPEEMVLAFESSSGWNQCGGLELLATENHNGEGCNIVFADGHVKFVKVEEIPLLKWTVEKKE